MTPQFRFIRAAVAACTLMLAPAVTLAQSTGTITGTVLDAKTRAPLASATVRLVDPADSTFRSLGDVTSASGAFTIERVPLGQAFVVETSFVGYERIRSASVTLSAERPSRAMGEILLAPSDVGVGDVTVRAARPEVTVMADKTVYAVEDNPSITATNVSEVLAQLPSVEVDQDGKVSLRGSDNVTIMMNDRPLQMPAEQRNKFLQSLPANMVRDIEIRTNPGAQFDASNGGGIINIVTRRTMSDMFGGNINTGVDSRVGFNGGGNFYYNGSDLTASIGGGANIGENGGSHSTLRLNYLDSAEYRDVGFGANTSKSSSQHGYGQIDYKLTELLLASVSFNLNHWGSNHSSNGSHSFFDAAGNVVGRSFDTSAPGPDAQNSGGYNSASFLLKHTFSDDHTLSFDVAYNGHGYSSQNNYSNTYLFSDNALDTQRTNARKTIYDRSDVTVISRVDYNNPLSEALSIALGAKNERNMLDNLTSVSSLDHTSGEFVLDARQTSHYLPENDIWAAYGNVSYRPFTELGIQAGLRVETAKVSAEYVSGEEIITRNYTNFFPSGSLAYTLSEAHTLTGSYRRSIALPDIDALNPTRVRWSDFMESSGNPDLEPEFTHTFELNYSTFWAGGNMISVAPYYSTTEGNIERSERLIDGVTLSSSANFNGSYMLGSEASVSLRPFPWLNFRVSGNFYNKVNRGSEISGDIYSSATGYNMNGSINADVTETTTLSANVFMNAPAATGGSSQSGYSFMSFNARQRLFDKKLTISLRVNDPFNLQKWSSVYDTPQFHTEMESKWTSRFVGLNISYTFGTTPRMEQHRQEKTETKGGGGAGAGGGGGGGE